MHMDLEISAILTWYYIKIQYMKANETPSYSHENNLFEIVIWLKKEYLIDLEHQHASLKCRVITIHA